MKTTERERQLEAENLLLLRQLFISEAMRLGYGIEQLALIKRNLGVENVPGGALNADECRAMLRVMGARTTTT